MDSAFARAANDLDEETFLAPYGRWDPLDPGQVAELFAGSPVPRCAGGSLAAGPPGSVPMARRGWPPAWSASVTTNGPGLPAMAREAASVRGVGHTGERKASLTS